MNAIEKLIYAAKQACVDMRETCQSLSLYEAINPAISELARLREAQRWIPVAPDTMPEMDKAVWVWSENRPLVAMRSNPENEEWCWYVAQRGWDLIEGDFEMDDIHPTAWRELPPPPEVRS